MVLHGDEYCFISLPLAVNFKTRDWIRVIIGVESRKGMMEIMWDMRNKLHVYPTAPTAADRIQFIKRFNMCLRLKSMC
ncbi:unnamed protein product [Brassica oleracea var. botrytis]